ncbi:hypothetical protein PMAYCL1PPCAC_12223, partial [Pristionchus mayeri]
SLEMDLLRSTIEEQEKTIADLSRRLRETQEELEFSSRILPSLTCGGCVHAKGRLEYYLECPSCLSRVLSQSPHLTWANQITDTTICSEDEQCKHSLTSFRLLYCVVISLEILRHTFIVIFISIIPSDCTCMPSLQM